MRVALDPGVRDLLAKADELREALDRRGAHRGGTHRDDERDREQRERPPSVQGAQDARAEQDGGDREPHAEDGRHRAREDHAERAGDHAHERPAPPCRPAVPERDPQRAHDERRARERGEVVDADERRLPLARPLALELGDDAEELEEPPRGRRDAPGDDCAQQRNRVRSGADEEHGRREKAGVPGELRDADRVDAERVVLPEQRRRRERDRADEDERGGQPEQRGPTSGVAPIPRDGLAPRPRRSPARSPRPRGSRRSRSSPRRSRASAGTSHGGRGRGSPRRGREPPSPRPRQRPAAARPTDARPDRQRAAARPSPCGL